MKKSFTLVLITLWTITTHAQLNLDIDGDARITGALDITSGSNNTFVGRNAGVSNTSGSSNTFFGSGAGRNNTIGLFNVFVGHMAGATNDTGDDNIYIGDLAGQTNSFGLRNIFVGSWAGVTNSGSRNIFIGSFSAQNNTSGNNNTFIGDSAGGVNRGSNNTFIGYQAGDNSGDISNAIAIGSLSDVSCNNCAVIGGSSTKLGIGTPSPQATLDVNGEIQISTANIPMGFTNEVNGNSPILNMDVNFRQSNQNTTYRGAAFRIDSRDNNSIFQWLKRSAGSTSIGELLMDLKESGDLTVSGTVVNNFNLVPSDLRYKKSVIKIERPLNIIQSLDGVFYEFNTEAFKEKGFNSGQQIGFIAQEVEKVLPMLVKENAEGYKGVNYDGIIPLLIEGMKEQQRIISDRGRESDQLKELLLQQQQEIDELKSLVELLVVSRKED